jgi:hypothetical protein
MNVSFGRTVVIRDNIGKKQAVADSSKVSIIEKPEDNNRNNTQYEIWGNTPYPLMIVNRDPGNFNLKKIAKQLNNAKSGDEVSIIDINPDNTSTNKGNKEIIEDISSYEVYPRGSEKFRRI